MKLKVYAVYDQKVGEYLQPFFMRTNGEALRAWVEVVNDPKTEFYKHGEDYTLFELGDYDGSTGQFQNLMTPFSHGKAHEFQKRNPQTNMLTTEGVVE